MPLDQEISGVKLVITHYFSVAVLRVPCSNLGGGVGGGVC